MKALIDRSGFVAKANGDILQRKLGAAVVAMRRGGSIHAFDTLNHALKVCQNRTYLKFSSGCPKPIVGNVTNPPVLFLPHGWLRV